MRGTDFKSVPSDKTLAFYKPYGVLCSFTDRQGRPTLKQFIPIAEVYPAGRLDFDSEGLLLLTSDGRLAHRITDPASHLRKTYWAQVEREPDADALAHLRRGVRLADRCTRPAQVALLSKAPAIGPRPVPIRFRKSVPTAWLRIAIHEGMNRQVRRMTAAVGHPTLRLIRAAIGPITVETLQPGEWRELTATEVEKLWTEPG